MLSKFRLAIFLILMIPVDLNAQDTLSNKIVKGLEVWGKNYPVEKAFLHTDKSTYLAGENIWYKAYITLDGAPTFLSQILYVDFVDEKGKVIEKQMLQIKSGMNAGDIIIPKTLPSGNYAINAYTLWMLNFKPFVFQKDVRIYNNDYKPSEKKAQAVDFTINFFPEGGDLVEGLKSVIAFHATNKSGIPLDVKGSIIGASGNKITDITTLHSGYGKFEITPASEDLTAVVNVNGFEKKFKLPKAKKEGITLNVNNLNPNRIFVQVDRKVVYKNTFNELLVVAQMYGKPIFLGKVNFNEDATGMAITKKNLPAGVMQITIFEHNGQPLAERLVFLNNMELQEANLKADTISLANKGRNHYKIDLSKYTTPSVSVSIVDADVSSPKGKENNIVSNLLLTSDLKGYVHNPGHYFQNKSSEILEHLDLLMLTHGWRRFKWEEVINKKDIALRYPVESAISLSGKVTIPQSTKTIGGGHVDIITKGEDSTTILSKAVVNEKGEFYINDLNFKHKATVYLQGSKNSNKNANVDVILNKSYIDTLKFSDNRPQLDLDTFSLAQSQQNRLLNLINEETKKNSYITLSEVKVTARKTSRIDSLANAYASDMFQMGQNLELTSTHYISVWQFLREQVNGLVVEGDMVNPNVYFTRLAGTTIPGLTGNEEESTNQAGGIESNGITYFLNEINVTKDVVSTLHPSDIALVKVFKGPEGAALGMNEGGIAIYTKKGTANKNRSGEKGFFTEQKMGYTVTREFYNPDYSLITDNTNPDTRTTLYWNPNVKLDKTGHAHLRFYNNDITKKFKVVIQGIDKQGKLIFIEEIIQ
jgi:hypothetical protein